MTSSGVPMPRVKQILASVLKLSICRDTEPFMLRVDVHRANEGRYRHDYGLALAMAMVSSLTQQPLAPQLLFLGDVDLHGNVQDVSAETIDRLNEAINAFEIETPLRVVLAPASARWVNASSTVKVLPAPTLATAVAAAWPGQVLKVK
jgi:predicted ATP-dependent serine protease